MMWVSGIGNVGVSDVVGAHDDGEIGPSGAGVGTVGVVRHGAPSLPACRDRTTIYTHIYPRIYTQSPMRCPTRSRTVDPCLPPPAARRGDAHLPQEPLGRHAHPSDTRDQVDGTPAHPDDTAVVIGGAAERRLAPITRLRMGNSPDARRPTLAVPPRD